MYSLGAQPAACERHRWHGLAARSCLQLAGPPGGPQASRQTALAATSMPTMAQVRQAGVAGTTAGRGGGGGADMFSAQVTGTTPLHRAAQRGNEEEVAALLEQASRLAAGCCASTWTIAMVFAFAAATVLLPLPLPLHTLLLAICHSCLPC